MNKKLVLFVFLFVTKLTVNAQSSDPVALNINGSPIYKSEIERAYNKHAHEQEQKEKHSFDNFLQSYIDFRINTEEAKKLGMDTTASYKREYYSYKAELGRSYLRDSTILDNVLSKYYERTLQDVQVNHLLIPYDKKGSILPSDTLELYNKALTARQKFLSKGFNAKDIFDNTSNPSLVPDLASINGHLGWVTAFMLPLQLEDAIYSLPEGAVSVPIRTQRGYHLVQVVARRPAIGAVRIDQVLFNFPVIPPSREAIDSVGSLVYRLQEEMNGNEGFQILCDRFSEVYNRGDKKCEFGIVKLDSQNSPSFIYAALGLKNIGDISEPVMTDYGYHIIRLTAKISIPEFAQLKSALKSIVLSGDRGEDYKSQIEHNLSRKFGKELKPEALINLQNAATKVDIDDPEYLKLVTDQDKVLLVIGGSNSYTVRDFLSFVQTKAAAKVDDPNELPSIIRSDDVYFNLPADKLNSYLTIFATNKLYDYAEETLEKRYPEFDAQMKEYAQGILLFDVKNANIWTKAQSDEEGLAACFEKNRDTYKWDTPHYKGVIFYCKDEDTAKKVESMYIQNGQNDAALALIRSTFNAQSSHIIIESDTWSKGENPYIDNKAFGENKVLSPMHNYPYTSIIGRFISVPEDFRDVRGAVQEDYQKNLETEWITYLRKKYKVVQNKSVLKSIKHNK